MFLATSSMTPERQKAVDFSTFVAVDFHSFVLAYPVPESDVAGFIKPFTLEVSALILGGKSYSYPFAGEKKMMVSPTSSTVAEKISEVPGKVNLKMESY